MHKWIADPWLTTGLCTDPRALSATYETCSGSIFSLKPELPTPVDRQTVHETRLAG